MGCPKLTYNNRFTPELKVYKESACKPKSTFTGHGTFNLRHTFSPKSKYVRSQGTTDNLMDYSDTDNPKLNYYQWNEIHNPVNVLFGSILEKEEEAAILSIQTKDERATGKWVSVNPPEMYNGKLALTYNKRFVFDDGVKYSQTELLQLTDGSKFLSYPDAYDQSGKSREYKIKPNGVDNYHIVYLQHFENVSMEKQLEFIGKKTSHLAGTTIGRYLIPVEDAYILISGEDFDGNEASRIAAGGFIILEVVQVGKIFKLVKGTKLVGKGSKSVSASMRVIKQFSKEVSKDAFIDMSAQFVINFMGESLKNKSQNEWDITVKALADIDLKNAIISGMISYASLENNIQEKITMCALEVLTNIQDTEQEFNANLKQGFFDCGIEVGISVAFDKLKHSEKMKNIISELNTAANRDLILNKFSKIISSNEVFSMIEESISNSLQNGIEQ